MKHFIDIKDFSKEEILKMLALAIQLKKAAKYDLTITENKVLALIFQNQRLNQCLVAFVQLLLLQLLH